MVDFSAITKWPNVPACYEWLSLDRRGRWRLQGEPVTHRGLIEFMNRQYTSDESGNWFVQNGPQRVFVDLAATPWIYRLEEGQFITHTDVAVDGPESLFLDEEGSLYLLASPGIGLIDDRDLPTLISGLIDTQGNPVSDEKLAALLSATPVKIFWQGMRVEPIAAASLPSRFGFFSQPRP